MQLDALKTTAAAVAFAALAPVMPARGAANDAPPAAPVAVAAQVSHPLLAPLVRRDYTVNLADKFKQVAPKEGSLTAIAFSVKLAEKLAAPLDRPQMVYSPDAKDLNGKNPSIDTLVVGTIIPPVALYPASVSAKPETYANIPVCMDQNGAVLWKGEINALNGTVVEDKGPVPAVDANSRACRGWLRAAGLKMQERVASTPPADAPPPAPATAPKVATAAVVPTTN